MDDEISSVVGVTEAAKLLGTTTTKVKRLAKNGVLPHAHKLPGRTGAYLFDREVVEQFAAERASAPAKAGSGA